nr:AAA family ATPase [Eubacterium sp.]
VGDEDFRPINVCEMFHSICRLVCRIEYNIEKTKDQGIRDDFSDTASWLQKELNSSIQSLIKEEGGIFNKLVDFDFRFKALGKMFDEWDYSKTSLSKRTLSETFYESYYDGENEYYDEVIKEINFSNLDEVFDEQGFDSISVISIMMNRSFKSILLSIKDKNDSVGNELWNFINDNLSYRGNLQDSIEIQNKMTNELKAKIIGQDMAIDKFVKGYCRSLTAGHFAGKPEAVYLFAGPPGVGKTYLAEQFAKILGPEGYKYKRFDMSAYSGSANATQGLVGFEKTWKAAQEGALTGFVDRNPRSILLIDEIEKASAEVRLLFLSILEGAILTDKYLEKQVSFSQTILIFTTNEGKDIYMDNRYSNLTALPDSTVVDGLQSSGFAPELLSRFASSNIIVFNYLQADALSDLVKMSFKDTCKRVSKRNYNLKTISYDPDLMSKFYILSKGGNIDARNVSAKTKSLVVDLFNDAAMDIVDKNKSIKSFNSIEVSLDEASISEEAKRYLIMPSGRKALYYGDDTKTAFKYIEDKVNVEIVKDYETFKEKSQDNNPNSDNSYDAYIIDIFKSKDTSANDIKIYECLEYLLEKKNEVPIFFVDRGLSKENKKTLIEKNVNAFIQVDTMPDIRKKQICILEDIKRVYFIRAYNKLAKAERCLTSIRKMEYKSSSGHMNIIYTNIDLKKATIESARERALNKRYLLNDKKAVYLKDIFGNEKAVEVAKRCIDNIRYPERYINAGVKLLKGILMYGEPGMGKTMLAKAMAFESGASFISTVGSDFLGGNGISELDNIFEAARRQKPCIIFIDEFDAIAKSRKIFSGGMAEMILEKFLQEMDGVGKDNTGVYVVGATNYPLEYIDDAIIRRFSEKIVFERPSGYERCKFLGMLFDKKGLSIPGEYANVLVRHMFGYQDNYSEIETFINESIAELVYEKQDKFDIKRDVTLDYLLDRLQEINYGEKREESEDIIRTCFHEAGHAVMQKLTGRNVEFMTVVSRGRFDGFAMSSVKLETALDFINHIRISLAGRAAEIIYARKMATDDETYKNEIIEAINVGASDDLKKATKLAYDYVCAYGFKDFISVVPDGFISGSNGIIKENILPESRKEKIWDEVENILKKEMDNTIKILSDHWSRVTALAYSVRYLREIDGRLIDRIIQKGTPYIDRTCFVDFDQDYVCNYMENVDEEGNAGLQKIVCGYPIWPKSYISKDRKLTYDPEKEYYYAVKYNDKLEIYKEDKNDSNILPKLMEDVYKNNGTIVRFATKDAALEYLNSKFYMITKKNGQIICCKADDYMDPEKAEEIDKESAIYKFPFEIIDKDFLDNICSNYEAGCERKLSELGKIQLILNVINSEILNKQEEASVVLQLYGPDQINAFVNCMNDRNNNIIYDPVFDYIDQ